MKEENSNINEPQNEDWEVPQLPEEIKKEKTEEPQMSEVATLGNIFLEPGNTFKDLKRKPRFIMAAVIIAILATSFAFTFRQYLGEERIKRFTVVQLEKNSQFNALKQEQQQQQLNFALTFQKIISFLTPIFVFIFFLIGSLLYWGANKAMGGNASFIQSLTVWIYSTFPPTVVSVVANFLILFLKTPDEIDIASSQGGLIKANPTMLFDGKEMPVLTTLISTLDLFLIWGIVLAVIGMKKMSKLSTGGAFGVVFFVTLIIITIRVLLAFLNGVPS
jgi:hypothetical protein